jgi:hypothetical protein
MITDLPNETGFIMRDHSYHIAVAMRHTGLNIVAWTAETGYVDR